jgi:phenylalanyl-tRNA synthetase beta subunit
LVSIEITDPELNPRFVIGLIRDVEIKPSPYQVQRRLRLAGIRPHQQHRGRDQLRHARSRRAAACVRL